MRPVRPQLLLIPLLVAIAGSNLVFSLACIGCGKSPAAPEEVRAGSLAPGEGSTFTSTSSSRSTASTGSTGGTADTGAPAECLDAPPSLALARLVEGVPEPLGSEVHLQYKQSCTVDSGLTVAVSPTGLAPGPVDVAFAVVVDGEASVDGLDTWDLACLADGTMAFGRLTVDLPKSADGAAVTLDVVLVDGEGTTVAATHSFVAAVHQ